MRTSLFSLVLASLFLTGCAAQVIRVFVPTYPDFPRYPAGYTQTECTYRADAKGMDQNGSYTIHVDSTKVTDQYADGCRPTANAKKK